MAENKKSFDELMSKLALVGESLVSIIPNSKQVVVFSLDNQNFSFIRQYFNNNSTMNQFKIDMSGVEFIFLKDELLNNVEDSQ
jgi:hypothetical protein